MTDFIHEEHKGLLVGRANGLRHERANPSESYVSVPPAFIITDSDGACWTFGTQYVEHNGRFQFSVLRDDVDTGEVAERISYEGGIVTIHGYYGRKRFSRNRTTFI